MKRHSSGFIIGIIASLVLGFGIIAVIALGLQSIGSLGFEPGVLKATKTGPDSAKIEFSTWPDGHVCHDNQDSPQVDWVTYCPTTSFEVPANSLITVVIKNYDSSTGVLNDYFRHVHGTVGGNMLVDNKSMTQLDVDAPAHTFTLQSTPDSPNPLFVSVPLLGVADDAPTPVTINGNQYPNPNVISFQFRTGATGTFVWHCYVPCGEDRVPPYGFSGPMATTGYMAGRMTVSSY